jgi:PAS domain S-box-containing protein
MMVALEELRAATSELRSQEQRLVETEEALNREHRRMHELWENSPFGFVVTDRIGLIRYASSAAATLLGMKPERLEKKPLALFIAEEDRAGFRTWLCDVAQGLPTSKRDVQLVSATSERYVVSVWARLGEEAVNKTPEVHWALVDVTDDRRQERELAEKNRELERKLVELELRFGARPKSAQRG